MEFISKKKKLDDEIDTVTNQVQSLEDDSNLFIDLLENVTNEIRDLGVPKDKMNSLIQTGQIMIGDVDDAEFMAMYKQGDVFRHQAKVLVNAYCR